MIVEDQSEVIGFLSRPGTYGGSVDHVDVIETHASVIFLAGDRAYKLKRAVKFPYLDYSTADQRRRFCQAELRINKRTAPDIYLAVLPVSRDERGSLRLGPRGDPHGEPVDWLVEMGRFDQATLFDRLAQKGVLDRYAMEDLADTIARFHQGARQVTDAGGRGAIARIIESNTRCFAESATGLLDSDKMRKLGEASWRALAGTEQLLEERRAAGMVRHCHGDLHLRNIFLHKGQATLFDAIEFSAELADIDVLYDTAFLVMDLDHRGLRDMASILLNRYLDNTGDAGGLGAMPLFLSLRAAIRSHVLAASLAPHPDRADAGEVVAEMASYLDRALDYLTPIPPRLIAIGGLSGSGKSRMARWLSPHLGMAPGARVVRTDSTRKRLAGIPLGQRLGPGGYSKRMTERTYRAVYDECRRVLIAGQSVIADAVFGEPEERQAIEQVAHEVGVPFHGVWLEASPEVMQERVTRRTRNVSDATAWVVRLQLQHDVGPMTWTRLDTSGTKDQNTRAGLKLLGLA
ncbi:MAG: hypothetical protein EA405_01870 [Rhodospirillales bacterium]|nr:MAG: hypothetical protein EA405_01870 [Rhodospirillales bacterium]